MSILRVAFALLFLSLPAVAQQIGISGGFPYSTHVGDTAQSAFLPSLPSSPAGAHGFLGRDPNGDFRFGDGTPARFFGVSFQWASCYPDSSTAIATAARLRKLGVNVVRFMYFDGGYDWYPSATYLDVASGFRTINASQIDRLDRFVAELKKNGIYSYFMLGARIPRREDGLGSLADSILWMGFGAHQLYPQSRDAQKLVARLLLEHVNPYTKTAYKDEPAIAMIDVMGQGSLTSLWRQRVLNYVSGSYTFSFNHSRRLDTLFAGFLRAKYSNAAGLAAAWNQTPPNGGFPDLIREGSFEGDFDREWTIEAYNGPSVSKLLVQGDSVPKGSLALTLRVRNSIGAIINAYMYQALSLKFNTLYRLSFKAKASNPAGRQLYLRAAQENGLGTSLDTLMTIHPYWSSHEAYFLVPYRTSATSAIAFYYGEVDGDLSIDDIQLREAPRPALVSGESLDASMIIRIPWGNPALAYLPSKRIEDQSEFYMSLDSSYIADIRSYIKSTVGAKQLTAGANIYWASSPIDAHVASRNDFSSVSTGWDYLLAGGADWRIINYSPLRQVWSTNIYDVAAYAHATQPLVASISTPFPNRYQAEVATLLPAYASLQGWDGVLLDVWADGNAVGTPNAIDSLQHSTMAKNPVITALMPALSQIFRDGYIATARPSETIRIQRSTLQTRLQPRMEWAWGHYGLPGGVPGYTMAVDRVVIDSIDAKYPTQYDDISFPDQSSGSMRTTGGDLTWEYTRGALVLNAARAQGVSGYLTRGGGFSLNGVEINVLSNNETATILWTALDSGTTLNDAGRSLLTIVSRAEPTGMRWVDTSHADVWGSGSMLLDPVRVQLTFGFTQIPEAGPMRVTITPLDSTGRPNGEPIVTTGSNIVTIDQRTTKAVWYAVETERTSSAPIESLRLAPALSARVDENALEVRLALPGARERSRLELFDILGNRVATLRSGRIEGGEQRLRFSMNDLPAGAYFVRLTTERGETMSTGVVR